MTVADALQAAARRLAAAGVDDPAGDARALMAHALGAPRDRLTLLMRDPLPEPAAARFEAALEARARRRPVSRIIGRRAFFDQCLEITDAVLDPRPETETLVAAGLEHPFLKVIDLGTGSGAILLALLAARPEARGLGTDLSEAALEVAATNATALGLETRAQFQRADWWKGITGRFDLVVSNPPYIAEGALATLAPEVAAHDPVMALSPGPDALAAYRGLLPGLAAHLAPGGRALFEFGAGQGPELCALARASGFDAPNLLPDLDGRPRVLQLSAPA